MQGEPCRCTRLLVELLAAVCLWALLPAILYWLAVLKKGFLLTFLYLSACTQTTNSSLFSDTSSRGLPSVYQAVTWFDAGREH